MQSGVGALQNLEDLLRKLWWDFDRVKEDQKDSYAAFDFFVTAEHMVDWAFPGKAGRNARTALRKKETLLQVVSHIASGSKHFKAEAPHHDSVSHVDHVGGPFDPGAHPPGVAVGDLYVTLKSDAANALGA